MPKKITIEAQIKFMEGALLVLADPNAEICFEAKDADMLLQITTSLRASRQIAGPNGGSRITHILLLPDKKYGGE